MSDGEYGFAPADAPVATAPAPAPAPKSRYDNIPTIVVHPGDGEFGFAPAADPGPEPPASGAGGDNRKTGYAANLAAGGNAAVADTLGLPVDLTTGGINLITRGINAATGTHIAPIVDPVGGSGTFKRAMGVIGANPDDVRPDGIGQEFARGVGGGVVSSALPTGIVSGLKLGGVIAAPMAKRVLGVLGEATPQNLLLGASSGGAGEVAAAEAPDEWKPVAGLGGGLLGVGVPLVGAAGVRGAYRAASDYAAPAFGRRNPLLDVGGEAPVAADGTPINALATDSTGNNAPLTGTDAQVRIAAQRLQAAASDPAAVRNALADQAPPTYAGSPTTAQLSRDPGLLAAERGVSRAVPGAQASFLQQAAGENDARVGMLRGIAEGANPQALPAELQNQARAAEASGAARVAAVEAGADSDVAATDAAGQAEVARLQQAADQTRSAIGGDLPAGSDAQVGASVRAPLKAADDVARARESAAWQAIDPEGKLNADVSPVARGADAIVRDQSPRGEPLAGKEEAIFDTARQMSGVEPFRDLAAFRTRLTDAIRQERTSPSSDPQTVRRLSLLLGHVHEAMEGSVAGTVADDARAVANGTMAPDQTSVARLRSEVGTWDGEADAASAQRVSDRSGNAGQYGSSGPGAVSPVVRDAQAGAGQRQPGGRSGSQAVGGNNRLAPGATDEVRPSLGQDASNRKLQTLHDFVIMKGGVKDESGEYSSQDLDRIHHRMGGRLINNTRGMGADYMREAAVQEGFLPANADLNDFHDAMMSQTPVYRIEEAHEAAQRRLDAQQTRLHEETRYNSRDAVAVAADQAGIRLKPGEIDHATDLHMQGVHPEDAIRQAVGATEATALDRNAAANAVGSPGVPLAARQAQIGLDGGSRLEANFGQADAARYAAARALTSDRKGGLDAAPGVKSILQGGSTAGSFRIPDASVASSVIRVGPAGADHVNAYLAKGGSAEALSDAAAFSLRRDAMRPDGTLDPAKYAKWAKDRESFLAALPDAKARFGAAADAQRAVDAGTKDAADALKQATATAKRTIDEATAAQASAVKARQSSVLGKFIPGADPVAVVGGILNDAKMGRSYMAQLADAVKGDPDATASLQRLVSEHMTTALMGNKIGVGGVERNLKADQLQTFLRMREPALREVLNDQQMGVLRNVASSLERSELSVSGSKLAGGSDTIQNAAAGANAAPTSFTGNLVKKIGSSLPASLGTTGATLGFFVGGPIGAGIFGAAAGAAGLGMQALQAAREAGLNNATQLYAAGVRYPQIGAILMAKATPENRDSLLRALTSRLRRISLVSSAVGQQSRTDDSPRNALMMQ